MIEMIVEVKVTCRVVVMNLEDVVVIASQLNFQLDVTFVVLDHVFQFFFRPTTIGGILENKWVIIHNIFLIGSSFFRHGVVIARCTHVSHNLNKNRIKVG